MTDDKVIQFPSQGPGWSGGDVQTIEADLAMALGLPVSIMSGTGNHVITIRANGLEGLDRFCNVVMSGARVIAEADDRP